MKVRTIRCGLKWAGQTRGGNWLTIELGAEAELGAREKVENAFPKLVELVREQLNERWRESNRHGAPAPKLDGHRAGARQGLAAAQTLSPDVSRGGN